MAYEDLQRALSQNAASSSQLTGVDEQMMRALALRDQPQAQAGAGGYVSPLAIAADVIGQSRGRQQVRRLQPQQEQLRQQVAAGSTAMEGHKLKMTMEKADREREAHERKMGTYQGEAETWKNSAGDKIAVVYDENRKPIDLATGEPPVVGFVPPEGGRAGGYKSSKSFRDKFKVDFVDDIAQMDKVSSTAAAFKSEYAQINNIPTEFMNNTLVSGSRNDILKYITGAKVDAKTKESMLWWADWRMNYSLMQRHKLFGATLTNNELRSWKDAEMMILGGDPAFTAQRMAKLVADMEDDQLRQTNAQYAGASTDTDRAFIDEATRGVFTRGPDGRFSRSGGPTAVNTSQSPEGIDPAEWADLDEDERAYFMENMVSGP